MLTSDDTKPRRQGFTYPHGLGSSVDLARPNNVMAYLESELLHPLPEKRKKDVDNWPEYQIKSARIISEKTGVQVSLLGLHAGHSATLEGVLDEIDEEDQAMS